MCMIELNYLKGCDKMNWVEISIKTTTEALEAVSNILYDAGVAGVSIEDPKDILALEKSEVFWDYVDEALLNSALEGAIVKAYLPQSSDLLDKIELIKQSVAMLPQHGLDIGLGEVAAIEVNEDDWSSSWKQYYKPAKIGDRVVVKPTWEDYEAEPGDIVIELDPGMAFGTGTHETTIMCVRELECYVNNSSTVFDIGCGSGILTIAAAKLGAKKVVGVDLDIVAVEVSRQNIELNKVEDIASVMLGNLMNTIVDKADVIVANIIADVIILLSEDIKDFLAGNGVFIASGIILDKIEAVREAMEKNGLEVIKIESMGEWAAVAAKNKGGRHE